MTLVALDFPMLINSLLISSAIEVGLIKVILVDVTALCIPELEFEGNKMRIFWVPSFLWNITKLM